MTKTKQNIPSGNFFTPARNWLIACTIVSAIFVIVVATTTSLGFYVIPNAIVVLISLIVISMPQSPKFIFYPVLILSIFAAIVAVFLTLGFANYYETRA